MLSVYSKLVRTSATLGCNYTYKMTFWAATTFRFKD